MTVLLFFPFNVLIIFLQILGMAYLLNVFVKLFKQILSKDSWNIKTCFKV